MSFLPPNKEQAEELLKQKQLTPQNNYILATSRMAPVGKAAAWLLLRAPASIITNLFEKPYCLVFAKDKIVAIRLSGKSPVTVFKKSEIASFAVKDGLNETLIIEFSYQGETVSFYTYKKASYRIAYSAENLRKLEDAEFAGYAAG